jgi:paraquat-inducible protein A
MAEIPLRACHECDLLYRIDAKSIASVAKCPRCGAVLFRRRRNSLDRTLAFTLAGLILFAVANTFPFLEFEMQGQITQTTLITGIRELYAQKMWALAMIVFLTIILAPLIQLLGLIYVLLPLKLGRLPWKLPQVFRLVHGLQPWAMMEVFMLGILVSVVKLGEMAIIVPGLALWSYGILILALAGSVASLDPDIVWEKVGLRS